MQRAYMDSCTGKTGPARRGSRKIACGPPKLRAIFRISSTALRCAVSSEARMTADPLFPARCGRRNAVLRNYWQQLGRIEKLLRVVG